MAHNKLINHLPLVERMLQKVENTEAHSTWKHLQNLINSSAR